MVQDKEKENTLLEFERLQKEIVELKKDIDQSYYRIPKQEFESITVKKITQEVVDQVNKKVNFMRNMVAIIILILSFFGVTQWSKLTEGIQKSFELDTKNLKIELISDINKKLNVKMSDINTRFQEARNLIENDLGKAKEFLNIELNRISRNIEVKASNEAREAAKKETEAQLKTVREDIRSAQSTVFKTELKTLRDEVKNKTISYKEAVRKIDPFLQKVILLNNKELANEFLDELFRWTYMSKDYEGLDKIRAKYEMNFDLKAETWTNIAIGYLALYEETFIKIYKTRAISAYNNALERLPNYGVPHAVRLIIHMIDYAREQNVAIKDREKQEVLTILKTVNSGSNPVTAYETYNYLIRNKRRGKIGPFVNILFDNFPDQVEEMQKKRDEYVELLSLKK